jgi:hypothetical protein
MKLQIKTANGQTVVANIGQGPMMSSSQQPTGMPGVAALQILSGWGHGATAGLGGADWSSGCGVFRGEAYQMGPSFNQEADDKAACAAAGVSRVCSPSQPMGVWQLPQTIRLPVGGITRVSLTQPIGARLFAYEVCVRRVPLATDLESCCGCANDVLAIYGWKSRQINTTYPGLGRESGQQAIVPPGPFVPGDTNLEKPLATLFTAERLLNGQNFLPPWVSNVDLKNGNDELSWLLENLDPTHELIVEAVQHVRYGNFDLVAGAEAFAACAAC